MRKTGQTTATMGIITLLVLVSIPMVNADGDDDPLETDPQDYYSVAGGDFSLTTRVVVEAGTTRDAWTSNGCRFKYEGTYEMYGYLRGASYGWSAEDSEDNSRSGTEISKGPIFPIAKGKFTGTHPNWIPKGQLYEYWIWGTVGLLASPDDSAEAEATKQHACF